MRVKKRAGNSLQIHARFSQFRPAFCVVGKSLSHQVPKLSRMVELAQVTQLMHNNIVREPRRQKRQSIIEVNISRLRTTSPPTPLVSNSYFSVRKTIRFIKIFQPLFYQNSGLLFVFGKLLLAFDTYYSPAPYSPDSPSPKNNPPHFIFFYPDFYLDRFLLASPIATLAFHLFSNK